MEAKRGGMIGRGLARLLRLLFVVNPAACWLLLRGERRLALSYLREVWTLYLWPDRVPLQGAARLPSVPPAHLFPGLDLSRIELLHPMPRPGGVRIDELILLAALVRHLRPRRIVEIGTAEGRTTLNLALHAPEEAEIVTVDLPPDAPAAAAGAGFDYRQLGFAEPGSLLDHPLARKVRRVRADSTRFDWSPYERSVDFVFIDGGHDDATVRADSENALRMLRPGGVILWHDYNVYSVLGVTRVLNDLRQRLPVVWLEGTTLACFRDSGERG